jgi:hypothetical protein
MTFQPQPEELPSQPADLWQAILVLGQSLTENAQQQHGGTRMHQEAIMQLLDQLNAVLTTKESGNGPRHREPHMYNGNPHDLNNFLHEMTNALHLQHHALVTDSDKVLYFSFYLKDGSASSWYSSIKASRPDLLHNYPRFIEMFKAHFNDSGKHGTAL